MKRETTKNKKERQGAGGGGVRAETVFSIRIHYLAAGIKKKDKLEYMMDIEGVWGEKNSKRTISTVSRIQRRPIPKAVACLLIFTAF